ncbi:C45 family peptidase [Aureibacter tunicatorum]|uniref:Peptidase C45 hydrolase domain-containing protein n=1 Tax=Aureibacter tunicatorum TaxID=866807 RepID=A0AAE3XLD8_9BACT|nr:C45 family peptidase [Aureibacter tunicatorum]MDR6238640.1 hypothetical protein [Aureibacter tunicatorum]BDD05429.1 hypothetical protein AUTU_29120 [Aureibacter tunicatorum]
MKFTLVVLGLLILSLLILDSKAESYTASETASNKFISPNEISLDNSSSNFFAITVKGSPYERGFQHGKQLRKIIRPSVNRFKYDLVVPLMNQLGLEGKYDNYKNYFLNHTKLLQTASNLVPELVEEIKGIADGAQLDFEDLFIYNLNFDETFWVLEKMSGIDPILAMEKKNNHHIDGHCSHGSVWNNDKASVAYTLDWVRTFEGTQTLIKHEKENGEVLLMTTYAGTLIGHGINASKGYTFTPHSKFQLEHDVDNGLAQIFIYRKIIEAGSVEKAIYFLHKIKPAAGLAYTLTDYRGTRTYEISSSKIVEFHSEENFMVVCNAARVNDNLSQSNIKEYKLIGENIDMNNLPAVYWQNNKDSQERYDKIKQGIKKCSSKNMSPEKWQKIFIQKPINKPVNEELATSNLWHVVEIDKRHIIYHVSPGNPGSLPLETFKIKYK